MKRNETIKYPLPQGHLEVLDLERPAARLKAKYGDGVADGTLTEILRTGKITLRSFDKLCKCFRANNVSTSTHEVFGVATAPSAATPGADDSLEGLIERRASADKVYDVTKALYHLQSRPDMALEFAERIQASVTLEWNWTWNHRCRHVATMVHYAKRTQDMAKLDRTIGNYVIPLLREWTYQDAWQTWLVYLAGQLIDIGVELTDVFTPPIVALGMELRDQLEAKISNGWDNADYNLPCFALASYALARKDDKTAKSALTCASRLECVNAENHITAELMRKIDRHIVAEHMVSGDKACEEMVEWLSAAVKRRRNDGLPGTGFNLSAITFRAANVYLLLVAYHRSSGGGTSRLREKIAELEAEFCHRSNQEPRELPRVRLAPALRRMWEPDSKKPQWLASRVHEIRNNEFPETIALLSKAATLIMTAKFAKKSATR